MIRLFYGSGSPFAWRVQLALEEKGLPYEPVLLSFSTGEHKTPEHLGRHPHGKVPALADGEITLYESGPIVEYLEDRYREPPLLPAAPVERAMVRIEEQEAIVYFWETFRAVTQQAFFTPPERRDQAALAEARAKTHAVLLDLDRRAAARGGAFVAGAALTRADTTWLPFVEIAGRGGVTLGPTTPWLAGWQTRMRARPSYERSYPPHWRT